MALPSGCLSQVIPEHDPAPAPSPSPSVMDEVALTVMLSNAGYRGSGFVKVDAKPYESTLEPGALVTLYVSKEAAAAYEAVTPETMTAGAPFPQGGIIVREASDKTGKITALTTMVKRQPGYFPEVGDFFFGVTDVSGNPVEDDGEVQWGKVEGCATCHEGRKSSGWLFGVSLANRK